MAEPSPSNPGEMYWKPVWMFARCIGLLFDVGTLQARLLFNTLVYDTPHGKQETAEARENRSRD